MPHQKGNECAGHGGNCCCCYDRYWFIYWLGQVVSKALPRRAETKWGKLDE